MSSILFQLDQVLTKEMGRLFPSEEASWNLMDDNWGRRCHGYYEKNKRSPSTIRWNRLASQYYEIYGL